MANQEAIFGKNFFCDRAMHMKRNTPNNPSPKTFIHNPKKIPVVSQHTHNNTTTWVALTDHCQMVGKQFQSRQVPCRIRLRFSGLARQNGQTCYSLKDSDITDDSFLLFSVRDTIPHAKQVWPSEWQTVARQPPPTYPSIVEMWIAN